MIEGSQPAPRPIIRSCRFASLGVALVLVPTAAAIVVYAVGIAVTGGLLAEPWAGWWDHYERAFEVMEKVQIILLLLAGLFWVRWQYNATHNLRILGGEEPSPGPTLAAWSWAIPVANLVLPCLNHLQIARGSVPCGTRPSYGLVAFWWAVWVLSLLASWLAVLIVAIAEETGPWIAGTTVAAVSESLFLLSGLLAIQLIRRLTTQQQALLQGRTVSGYSFL